MIKSVIKSETDNNLKLRNRMIHYQELFEKRIATEQEKINRENEYFNSITQLSLHQISLAKTVSEKQQIIIELDKISTQKKQLLMEIKHKESLLKQSVIGYSSQMEAHIVAPIDGVISIINIQYGQRISIGQAIAIVIPEKAKSYVEMWLPPSALQEVKIGQSVLMRIESLPWQWFGKVRGKIELISKSPKKLSNDIQYFRLLIHFNNEIELPLGVNVEADILTRHRKVWQWIFYQQKNNINHIWDDN
ncbi:HlyD family efflux transporter periplasmic adaptor subunit [Providencia stuartii]|uniref:HlyD family secretion protein n=1 Tax=Providencia TaxID=586 RepID=UPI0029413F6F|nr:HlyD family efflux transporter periplasmic adaptor subunit [Providencia sp. 2023EL-00965]ELR5299579.1 HlyD family efflux transporter periplasmic adaptor subunit [Providencia stuartii]MDW7588650.1 HlyD family efflux transporter periplasmic adaptor subunit [Providencia sp. 2023EL-00965]